MMLWTAAFCDTPFIMGMGTIVTDGFISQYVGKSPDAPESDCRRLFNVYLPPQYMTNPEQTFPIVYHMTGFGGNYETYSASDAAAMDMMLAANQIVPIIIIEPDPRVPEYDGSYWVNSILNGAFESYIVEELIPYVNANYRQMTTASGNSQPFRAVMGQSMGGYGALYFGVKYPNLFVAYAGDSPTAFWLIDTPLATPNGNVMYTLNQLLIPELPPDNTINPSNGPPVNANTFLFYAFAGAFSPINTGPLDCILGPIPCLNAFPYCVAYPFETNPDGTVVLATVDGAPSLVPVQSILNLWETFDPYVFLSTVDQNLLARQAIYQDAGSNPVTEVIDNVGARYFADKLVSLNVNNSYILFNGGHTDCTTIDELDCYRFSTNLKFFSGKFSEAGIFAPDVRMVIAGTQTIELAGNAVMSINNKRLVGVQTDPAEGITVTNVTFNILDSAQLQIGNQSTIGGALQIGNPFGKANLLYDPSLLTHQVSCTFTVNGPGATIQIGRQGYLGFAAGIDGNQTALPNYWGMSTLTNLIAVTLNFLQGQLINNQIASSIDPKAALIGVGDGGTYTLNWNPSTFSILGGANFARLSDCVLINPTVTTPAGSIPPGGILSRQVIVPDPNQFYDQFYGPPNGYMGSETFFTNTLTVGIFASTAMLVPPNQTPLPAQATPDQFFNYFMVQDYLTQPTKIADIANLENQLTLGYLSMVSGQETIQRPTVSATQTCSPLDPDINQTAVLNEGAVGIKLATVNGVQTVLRVYDLNPTIT